ncbi:ABC transporter substrate-binding protein [Streptomyces sp. PT12]|uniref:ABC transporter substrate-binding protein n=1 Tax=Streptomyces sp. PT12 TaxID=1510197 RepID=UPI00215C2F55|nr:ABC transporter substrate-binding protein [Streptomyces sp. PT12]
MARRRLALPAVLPFATGALAATGCGASESGTGDGAPEAGGELTFALASDPGCVDPQQQGNNDAIYPARQLVGSLTDEDPETGEIVPGLAESWEVSEDARSFTFHLRGDATFSDGTPVDAEAVRANFDGIVELGARAALGSGYLAGYEGTAVDDTHTATVTFAEPNAQFLRATTTFSLGLLAAIPGAAAPGAGAAGRLTTSQAGPAHSRTERRSP